MIRQYSPRTFLRKTPNKVLKQYFDVNGIALEVDWSKLDDRDVDAVHAAIEKLDDDQRERIEADFRKVNELACKQGILRLLEEAQFWNRDWSEQFGTMSNAYERAFWAFLNERQRFDAAGCFHLMDRFGGWRKRMVGCGLEAGVDDADCDLLAAGLREFYRRQHRGRHCQVDHYERNNPKRHCYFAYPEDLADIDLAYDDGELVRKPHRNAFEIVFVYRPDEGVLELHANGKKADIEDLLSRFYTTILKLPGLPDATNLEYDLSVLMNDAFDFPTAPADRVDRVDLQMLQCELPAMDRRRNRRRIIFDGPASHTRPSQVHDLIDLLDAKRTPRKMLTPTQARLKFTFMPEGNEREKTLTFEISLPDRCTLKDDPHDQIAKKYLRLWGIAPQASARALAAAR